MPDDITILAVHDLQLLSDSAPISAEIARGAVVGLAGLDGHGQAEFIESLSGMRAPVSGGVSLSHSEGTFPIRNYNDAAHAGLAYLPSDRKKNGIFPMLGVDDNFLLGNVEGFFTQGFPKGGWLKTAAVDASLESFRKDLSISFATPKTPIRNLSGGNQQKVLLARIMAANPQVLLLNDPTRGVDIGTRHALYAYFRRAVDELGMTIVLLSTELDELVELCDRVFVFRDHAVFEELEQNELTLNRLMQSMFGQSAPAAKQDGKPL